MPTLAQADPSIAYAMFKGEPGTRKSTQALSYPKPQYWFSWDQKMDGLWVPAKKWGVDLTKEVTYDDYDGWEEAAKKLKTLQVNCPYKTLVFDSLTSCADLTLRQTRKARPHRTIAGVELHDIEDFNVEASALGELIAVTKDIKKYHKVNIILIAHVLQVEYRNTVKNETHISRTIVTAAKRIAAKIPAYCSEVYHFDVKTATEADTVGKFMCATRNTGDDFARTSLDLPHEIVFGDSQLYKGWIAPAIEKLKSSPQPEVLSTASITNKMNVTPNP